MHRLFLSCGMALEQLGLNSWGVNFGLLVLWQKLGFLPITPDEFRSLYSIKKVENSGWFYTSCPKADQIVLSLLFSTKNWKPMYFLAGGAWEHDPQEVPPTKALKYDFS